MMFMSGIFEFGPESCGEVSTRWTAGVQGMNRRYQQVVTGKLFGQGMMVDHQLKGYEHISQCSRFKPTFW